MTDDNPSQEGISAQAVPESLTRLIAPIFAVFSLPTIFVYVASDHPNSRWHDAVLSLLLVATGLFMASLQLSIGRLHDRFGKSLKFLYFRAYLTIIGIAVITLALTFLVCSQVGGWWIWLPLAVLLIGGMGPGLVMLFVREPTAGSAVGVPGDLARAGDGDD